VQPLLFPDNLSFWFETHRVLGHIAYGGADFGETVTTAQRITSGDYDSWYDEWIATAQRVEQEARSQLSAGHRVSAHDGLLRRTHVVERLPLSAARRRPPAHVGHAQRL
jgi:hypothetical protein